MSEHSFKVPRSVIDTYEEEGTACIRGAFSPSWVSKLLDSYDYIANSFGSAGSSAENIGTFKRDNAGGKPPLTYINDGYGNARLKNAVWADKACSDWLADSPAADIVGQVIGAKTLQFFWDQYFTKFGNNASGVTPWHHDIAAFSFYGMQLPSFWIALTDIDIDNAPLITAAGSHKRTHVMYRPLAGTDGIPLPEGYAERDEMINWIETHPEHMRTWTVRAGDALVIHPFTYHASLPRSPGAGRRVAYTSRWLGDDVVWRKREMTFTYPDDRRFDEVKLGEAPPETSFPIIWRSKEFA